MNTVNRFKKYVTGLTRLVEADTNEAGLLEFCSANLPTLLASDDWLDEQFKKPGTKSYQQYLLHCDPLERFSIVSFVWGPGQKTPIHDHTVWGVIGMLTGSELATSYQYDGENMVQGDTIRLLPGDIASVSPRIGDIHEVANALSDQVSVSIHTYGANIGRVSRNVYHPESGAKKSFISGYANDVVPNFW